MTLQRRSWSQQSEYRRIEFVLGVGSGLLSLSVAFLIAFTRPYDWAARLGALSIAFLGLFSTFYGAAATCRRFLPFCGRAHRLADRYFSCFRCCSSPLLIFPRKLLVPAGAGRGSAGSVLFPFLSLLAIRFVTLGDIGLATTGSQGSCSLIFAMGAGLLALTELSPVG
jgi:hypothetical protein